jgi:hypothetical protein
MNFKDMLEKISQLSEATEKTKTGVKHTGKYGKEYDTDEEGEEKKEPVAKRGRGRPAKDSEETKFDTSALSKAMGGKKPKKEVGTVSKKHTLKDWIENVEKNLLNEAPTPVPVMQQGSNKPAGAGIVTINDPNLKNTLGPTLDNLAQQKKISVVTTGQTPTATTGGPTPGVAQSNQNQQGTQAMAEDNLDEKIEGGVKLNPAKKGMFKGKTKAELTSQYNKLKASGPHKKGSPAFTKMKELAFAIRAKSGWGKVDEADIASTQGIDTEGANLGAGRNPNAFEGKKAKPDFLDLDKDGNKKESMKKAAADKKKAVKEGINHRIAAARLEGKAHGLKGHPHCGKNYDDMDECMAYHTGYKEGLDECYGMSSAGMMETEGTMPAATTSGMASQAMAGGMTEDHDSSEAAKSAVINRIIRQHTDLLGKYGPEKVMSAVEDCCGHLSNLEEIGSSDVSAWVNNVIRELKHHDVEEGNAFTGALAKTPKGGKFTVGGKTFTDNSNYDSKIDEYAFESWDKELSNLLNESTETINEGLTVSVSKGQQGSPDSVSINASDSEADQVLAFIKQAGLGLFGDEHGEHLPATVPGEHAVELEPAMPKIDVVDDHEGMMALMRKMSGGDDHGHSHAGSEDYADEESTDEEACNECGMAYESCGCEKEMVDEVESEDQMMYKVAEDNPPDNGSANSMNATKGNNAANTALAIADKKGPLEEENMEEGKECPTCHKDPCECDGEEEAVEESFAFESLYKKLAMIEGKESTAEKDDRAEKAAKKVAKDIEYDEGHKGKDDDKAEKAGKKVKKDIEYDDKKDKKLDEWANDAGPGKSVSDTTFEQDIDFMTKVIAGGLNKQKSTGQTTIPVVASQLKRQVSESTDSISDWKKLAGLK